MPLLVLAFVAVLGGGVFFAVRRRAASAGAAAPRVVGFAIPDAVPDAAPTLPEPAPVAAAPVAYPPPAYPAPAYPPPAYPPPAYPAPVQPDAGYAVAAAAAVQMAASAYAAPGYATPGYGDAPAYGGAPAPAWGAAAPAPPWTPGTPAWPAGPTAQPGKRAAKPLLVVLLVVVALGVAGGVKRVLDHSGPFLRPATVGGMPKANSALLDSTTEMMQSQAGWDAPKSIVQFYGEGEVPAYLLVALQESPPVDDVFRQVSRGASASGGAVTKAGTFENGDIVCGTFGVQRAAVNGSICAWSSDHTSGAVVSFVGSDVDALAQVTKQARNAVEDR